MPDALDYALYENFNQAASFFHGARFVDSIEEVLKINDLFNQKYNCYSACFLTIADNNTFLEFSVYIDKNLKQFYLRLDNIPNVRFRVKEDTSKLKLITAIRTEHFMEDMAVFIDNKLAPAIHDYFKDTKLDITNNPHFLAYVNDGDICEIKDFLEGIKNIRYVKGILELNKQDNASASDIFPVTFNNKLVLAESVNGKSQYIRDNRFLWSKANHKESSLLTKNNLKFIAQEDLF